MLCDRKLQSNMYHKKHSFFFLFMIGFLFVLSRGNDGNDVFTHNGITYTILTDEKVSWFDAYRKCTENSGRNFKHVVLNQQCCPKFRAALHFF